MENENKYIDKDMELIRTEVLNKIYDKKLVDDSILSFLDLDIYSTNQGNIISKLDKSFRQSVLNDEFILTHEQELCLMKLEKGNLFISAPTSFGKTFIALEFIARNIDKMTNVVFVVPTISLMNELRSKCYKNFGDTFILITSDSELKQYYDFKRKIIIVVPERINTNLFQEFFDTSRINILIYDEIYKLHSEKLSSNKNNSNDSRLIKMNYIYKYLLNRSEKVLLLGPFIKSVTFNRSKIAIDKYITNLNVIYNEIIFEPNYTSLITENTDKQFIYLSNPKNVEKFANKYFDSNKFSVFDTEIIDWISENVHPDWYYVNYIKQGVGIHHGRTPIFLRKYIENEYSKQNGKIHTIICTSTLIEGINTPTNKLLIIDTPRSSFELNNLIGRVGRLNTVEPKKGKVYITNNKTKDLYDSEKWIDLKILFETEEICSNSVEDECLFLDKVLPKDSNEQYLELSNELEQKFGIKYSEVIEAGIEFKVLKNFVDCHDSIVNHTNDFKVIQDIKFKILGSDNKYLSSLKLKNYSFGKDALDTEYLSFDVVYALLISINGMKSVIQNFTNTYENYTKEDINVFIDALFRIDEFIKFKMMKISSVFELFNSKKLYTKDNNAAFIQSVNMIKRYSDSKEGYERVLSDLGFPEYDINIICNEISKFNNESGTEKKLIKLKNNEKIFNNLSPFGKKIIENIN